MSVFAELSLLLSRFQAERWHNRRFWAKGVTETGRRRCGSKVVEQEEE